MKRPRRTEMEPQPQALIASSETDQNPLAVLANQIGVNATELLTQTQIEAAISGIDLATLAELKSNLPRGKSLKSLPWAARTNAAALSLTLSQFTKESGLTKASSKPENNKLMAAALAPNCISSLVLQGNSRPLDQALMRVPRGEPRARVIAQTTLTAGRLFENQLIGPKEMTTTVHELIRLDDSMDQDPKGRLRARALTHIEGALEQLRQTHPHAFETVIQTLAPTILQRLGLPGQEFHTPQQIAQLLAISIGRLRPESFESESTDLEVGALVKNPKKQPKKFTILWDRKNGEPPEALIKEVEKTLPPGQEVRIEYLDSRTITTNPPKSHTAPNAKPIQKDVSRLRALREKKTGRETYLITLALQEIDAAINRIDEAEAIDEPMLGYQIIDRLLSKGNNKNLPHTISMLLQLALSTGHGGVMRLLQCHPITDQALRDRLALSSMTSIDEQQPIFPNTEAIEDE